MIDDEIQILVKIKKDSLVDLDSSPMGLISPSIRRIIEKQVKEQVTKQVKEKVMKEIELPDIKITKKEIRERVLNSFANQIIKEYFEEHELKED